MEIVLIALGIVALAGLALTTMRTRAARRAVRRPGAVQWRGSAGSARRAGRARPAAAAVSRVSVAAGGAGTAVQDPPRTRVDDDAWDDDLEWTDDLDTTPAIPAGDERARGEGPGRTWGVAAPVSWPRHDDRHDPAPEGQNDDSPSGLSAKPAPIAPEEASRLAAEPAQDAASRLSAERAPIVANAASRLAAERAPIAAAPRRAAAAEAGWDDDLQHARPDGPRRPLPVARGAAAFGAATATPPAPRTRANPLRSPVALVALYALAGIALVVLAVSLLANGVSPTKTAPAVRASQSKPAAPKPVPASVTTEAASSSKDAAASRRRELEFQRAVSAAIAAQRQSVRAAREARRVRIAARRRAAERRRSARARARTHTPAPSRSTTPSYTAPAPSQAPAAPPSTGSGGGSSGGSGGGGGGGCEFCIG